MRINWPVLIAFALPTKHNRVSRLLCILLSCTNMFLDIIYIQTCCLFQLKSMKTKGQTERETKRDIEWEYNVCVSIASHSIELKTVQMNLKHIFVYILQKNSKKERTRDRNMWQSCIEIKAVKQCVHNITLSLYLLYSYTLFIRRTR